VPKQARLVKNERAARMDVCGTPDFWTPARYMLYMTIGGGLDFVRPRRPLPYHFQVTLPNSLNFPETGDAMIVLTVNGGRRPEARLFEGRKPLAVGAGCAGTRIGLTGNKYGLRIGPMRTLHHVNMSTGTRACAICSIVGGAEANGTAIHQERGNL